MGRRDPVAGHVQRPERHRVRDPRRDPVEDSRSHDEITRRDHRPECRAALVSHEFLPLRCDARYSTMPRPDDRTLTRSEEHTSELQSLMRISYAVLGLKKKQNKNDHNN